MVQVYISIGSNIDREKHIAGVLQSLKAHYGGLRRSSVYESPSFGFQGDPFYNLVVGFETAEGVHEIARLIRDLEEQHGRHRGEQRFTSRTLDLDMLLYGRSIIRENGLQLPRDEIIRYAFVLLPLSELAPDERHPLLGSTYGELWQSFDATSQPIWKVRVAEIT